MATPEPSSAEEARRARRLLRWVLGAVILFNLVLLFYVLWPR